MSKSGSRLRATPSTTTIVFCSSTSCGCICMSKRRVVSNNCCSSFAIDTSRTVRPKIGSPMARRACANVSMGCVCGHKAGVVMHLRHRAVIAREEAHQRFGHEAAHGGIEPAHDAEIDRDEAALARPRTDFPDACRHGKSRRAAPA